MEHGAKGGEQRQSKSKSMEHGAKGGEQRAGSKGRGAKAKAKGEGQREDGGELEFIGERYDHSR